MVGLGFDEGAVICRGAPIFTSAANVRLSDELPGPKLKSPVNVSALPWMLYTSKMVIAPTLVPTGRSLIIVRCDAPLGKVRESLALGMPEGDQLPESDQFALTVPVQ